MANISTYFPSGGSGASGGGIEGTNKFTIKAGSSSIPAGYVLPLEELSCGNQR